MARLVGRPRRERPIDRVNYKLDSGIRGMFKDFIQVKRFTEGMAVEKAMLQMMSIDRLINKNQELTYQSIEQEIERIWIELNQDEE
ncbi:MAG: hypothetical protein KME64_01425 [Scytonematopsis contorta HA4267-MV1]|jgi:hypothetical protein|nr:hypothetical protein [Scytonematopsis contorta HA4267-MV1]